MQEGTDKREKIARRRFVLFALVVLLVGFGWTFAKRPLPVPDSPAIAMPDNPRVDGVSLSVIPTATMESLHGFSVRGGSLTETFSSSIVAFVVEHPKGKFLVDAGAARAIESHLDTTPLLMRALTSLSLNQPTVDALRAGGLGPRSLKGIWLTHSHWDHVSGLADFGDQVPVWLPDEEIEYAWKDDGGKLFRELQSQANLQIRKLQFTDGAYGPFPWSKDYFGDGSVILLRLEGHTPGTTAVLVNLSSGKRYLIIGDTAWAREGVDWPAEKPLLSRMLADDDPALVRDQLVFLNKLQRAHPDLVIVPAHDARVHAQMAQFPNRER